MKKIALAGLLLAVSVHTADCASYDDLNVALSYFEQQQYDNAVTWFDKALAAGDLIPDLTRIAYLDRGIAYETKGDAGKAIADFTAAIAAQPTDMLAYHQRIAIYLANNELEKALSDYEQLDRLRPHSYLTLMGIGRLNWRLNRIEASANAFSYFATTDPYAWLWSQLANIRLGKPMMGYPDTIETRGWPHQLPRFYLGRVSESDVMEAAKSAGGDKVCIANIYTGLWHVVHNDQAQAAQLLETASKTCSKGSPLWSIAQSELKKNTPEGASK